ncbi:hypothetical protein BDY19DRAFT_171542 [Irpex rosettiformis]|uniref:Uncharacterized protein n=1 Tax=Irpex rosettiformis TaxID=378272 RepID=A0ACB8U3A9_9APHY|nr:hypothetical protein BDY19DRAFT_171542 [Irpex rosettiformis]
MVDWESVETLELCLILFRQTAVFVLGSYLWYIVLTLKDVELPLLLGRMRFRIVHLPYFLARYLNVCELLTIILSSYIPRKIHSCGPIAGPIILTAVSGNVALAASSTNIAFRVIMLWWKTHKTISHILIGICIVDLILAILLGVFSIDATWDEERGICLISAGKTQRGLLSLYCFTVVWHIVILLFTVLGIRRFALARSSPLSSMLYHQSFVYTIVTCVTCIPMAIVVYLNLNSILNILPALLGTTITVITSSSAVTSLFKLKQSSHSNPPNNSSSSSGSFPGNSRRAERFRRRLRARLGPRPRGGGNDENQNANANGDREQGEKPCIHHAEGERRAQEIGDLDFDLEEFSYERRRGFAGRDDEGSDYDDGGEIDSCSSEDDQVGALTTHINIGSTSDLPGGSSVEL